MEFKDYYKTLGVPKTATEKDIKQAFRKLARKHHPDVNPNDKLAEGRFKELTEANEVLSDPVKRRKYDELGSNWRAYEQSGPAGPGRPGGRAGGPQGGVYTMSEEDMREAFGGGGADPFSDFFHTFFGGAAGFEGPGGPHEDPGGRRARGTRARPPRHGRDVEHDIELTLDEAYHGVTRRLQMTHDGQARSVDVRIPAGIGDGSRVRVAGEGEHGSGGGKSGDLFMRVHLAPHPQFERKGRDLHTHVAVPVTTAVLGGEAEVATMSGKPLRLKIPPTTQNAQVFRLKGHGMPAVGKPAEHGDLYATVAVELPKELTPEARTHYEALQQLNEKVRAT